MVLGARDRRRITKHLADTKEELRHCAHQVFRDPETIAGLAPNRRPQLDEIDLGGIVSQLCVDLLIPRVEHGFS